MFYAMHELRLIPSRARDKERERVRGSQLGRQSFRISKTHIYIKWLGITFVLFQFRT